MADVSTNGCVYNSSAAAAANYTALQSCLASGGEWTVSDNLYLGDGTLSGTGSLVGSGKLIRAGTEITIQAIGGINGLTIAGRVVFPANASILNKQLINLTLEGGQWIFRRGSNFAGTVLDCVVTSVDESIVGGFFAGFIKGFGYTDGFVPNGGMFKVNCQAELGYADLWENVIDCSAQNTKFVLSGFSALMNFIRFGPITYAGKGPGEDNFPWASTYGNTIALECDPNDYTHEERIVRDSYGPVSCVLTAHVASVNGNDVVLTQRYSQAGITHTDAKYIGLDAALIEPHDDDNSRAGRTFPITAKSGSTITCPGHNFEAGDFISLCSLFRDNIVLDSTVGSGGDRGCGVSLFGGIYRCRVIDCTADIQDGFYAGLAVDPTELVLPNIGVTIVPGYIWTPGVVGSATLSNTAYLGGADNSIERCHVLTNKQCLYQYQTVVNDVDSVTIDYRQDYLPASLPRSNGYRNKLIDCTGQHIGTDAAIAIFDQQDFVYLGNTLPADRLASFPKDIGDGTGVTYDVDGAHSLASYIEGVVTITAWPGATIKYRWNNTGSYSTYTEPLEVTTQDSIEYYAEGTYYAEDPKTRYLSEIVGGSMPVRLKGRDGIIYPFHIR